MKKQLKSEVEEIVDMTKDLAKRVKEANIKYCTKKDEKPVIVAGVYQGLEEGTKPDYDKIIEEINESNKEYVKEEIEIKGYKIPEKSVPKKLKGSFQEIIMNFMEETEETSK